MKASDYPVIHILELERKESRECDSNEREMRVRGYREFYEREGFLFYERKRMIVCVETGEKFDGYDAVASALGIPRCYVTRAIRSGGVTHGKRFVIEGNRPKRRLVYVAHPSGEVFRTALEAGMRFGISDQSVRRSAKGMHTISGVTFTLEYR